MVFGIQGVNSDERFHCEPSERDGANYYFRNLEPDTEFRGSSRDLNLTIRGQSMMQEFNVNTSQLPQRTDSGENTQEIDLPHLEGYENRSNTKKRD